jgi:Mn2+/Fe2+ NRAMP family transporter
MTDMVNRRLTTALMVVTTVIITGLNLYLLGQAIFGAV